MGVYAQLKLLSLCEVMAEDEGKLSPESTGQAFGEAAFGAKRALNSDGKP